MKEQEKAIVTFTLEQIQRIRQIIMDNDKDDAIKLIKEIKKQIDESYNKSLKVGI